MFYTFTVKICRGFACIYNYIQAFTCANAKTDIVWFMHLNTYHRLFSSNTFNECKGFS